MYIAHTEVDPLGERHAVAGKVAHGIRHLVVFFIMNNENNSHSNNQ